MSAYKSIMRGLNEALEYKQGKVTPAMEIKEMSKKELNQMKSEIQNQLNAITAEEERKANLKKNYKLVEVEPEYDIYSHGVYLLLNEYFMKNETLTKDIFNTFVKSKTTTHVNKGDVYPCPKCGELELYPDNCQGNNELRSKYKIACNHCNFIAPIKWQPNDKYAWNEFNKWLIKKGFLKKEDETD